MRRTITLAAVAALALTTLGSITEPAHARDDFAMTHHHYWDDFPFNIRSHQYRWDDDGESDGAPTAEEVTKAIADRHACRPVVMYDDAGRHEAKADGCLK